MQSEDTTSTSVAIARIFWMVAGPFILLLLTTQIILSGTGWLTHWDAAFGLTLAAMIAARRHEFQAGDPRTADGAPAKIQDLRRFGVQVVAVGAVIWVIANGMGNHVLHRVKAAQAQTTSSWSTARMR